MKPQGRGRNQCADEERREYADAKARMIFQDQQNNAGYDEALRLHRQYP